MEWTTLVAVGLLGGAGLSAIYRSRTEGWATNRNVGTLVFLVGAAIGLFLDDLLPTGATLRPWVEPIGAAIVLVGLSVPWLWQSDGAELDDE